MDLNGNCAMLSRHFSAYRTGASTMPDAITKNEITREEFDRFLAWLDPDPEQAGEEYEQLRYRLRLYLAQRHCNSADELVDETINRVILKIHTTQIDNKTSYFYGVIRNVYQEWLRRQRTYVDIDDVVIPAKTTEEEPEISSECLDKCLEKLPPDTQTLLLTYFSATKLAKIKLRRNMSENLNTTPTSVRMRVFRGKRILKVCVEECMGQHVT